MRCTPCPRCGDDTIEDAARALRAVRCPGDGCGVLLRAVDGGLRAVRRRRDPAPPTPTREGAVLRGLREGRRLSIRAIAEMAGCSPRTWASYEQGRSSPTIGWLAATLSALEADDTERRNLAALLEERT